MCRFKALEPAGVEPVFDLKEPLTHSFVANGFVVHNCGEQSLPPWDACNLGSINVARFARAIDGDGPAGIDWDDLERVVRLAVRFLDDVIEVNPYPLPQIDATVKANRRIGLGVMGWADLLFTLGIPYDSEAALELADRLMAFVTEHRHDQSARLAEERGPFPSFRRSIYRHGRPLRNCTVTTIAPTGTISMIAGCSSGIEPVFALAFEHRVKGGEGERVLTFVSDTFERLAKSRGFYSEALMAEVARHGSIQHVAGVDAGAKAVFKTAHDIDWPWHVRHQAVFQKHTDNGVSKTVNLPHDAAPDDVAGAYLLAWQEGCLGITVFRDGCKGSQVLNVGVRAPTAFRPSPSPRERVVKPRPHSLAGATYRMETPIGTAFVTVNDTPGGEPFEVFVQVGKAGSDTMAVAEALGRLVSLVLRLPSPLSAGRRLEEVISQLSRIGGGQPTGFGSAKVLSLPDALARVLGEHIGQEGTAGRYAGGRAARAPDDRRSVQGVRPGHADLRGRVQEVRVVRLQRVLTASADGQRSWPVLMVGVEMTITRNPLHRSGRAGLTHPAPALGDNANATEWIGVKNAWGGKPMLDEPAHPRPSDVLCVTAPRRRAMPEPGKAEPEQSKRRTVNGHTIVAGVPTRRPDPASYSPKGSGVQAPPQRGLELAQLRLQLLPDRLSHYREPAVLLLPADVREAEEVEGLRLPLAAAPSALGRERARTRSDASSPGAAPDRTSQNARAAPPGTARRPLGTGTPRRSRQHNARRSRRRAPASSAIVHPEVEDVVQEDVGQERRYAPPLWRPLLTPCPLPVLQHPGVEPFVDQAQEAPVCDPVLDELHQPTVVDGIEEPRMSASSTQFTCFVWIPSVQRIQRIMRAASRPEPVREAEEVRFIDGVQHLDRRPLDDLVFQRGDAKRPLPPVGFGYVRPRDGLRSIRPRVSRSERSAEVLLEGLAVVPPRHPVDPGRGFRLQPVERLRGGDRGHRRGAGAW